MPTSEKTWELLPDEHRFVELSRRRLPEGWLVHATGVGGVTRFGAYMHYSDPQHEWQATVQPGKLRPSLKWERLNEPLEDFTARAKVPRGWLVFIDPETENSTAQLVFCPDADHKWRD